MELINTPLYADGNLLEYYQLENTSGKNGNTLTNLNSVTFTTAKYANGANLGSSNTNKSLTISTSNLGVTSAVVSITLWAKMLAEPTVSNSSYVLAQSVNSTTKNFVALGYRYNSGDPQVVATFYRIGNDLAKSVTYNTTLGITDFHHIAVTCDGTNFILWVDGVNRGTDTVPGTGTHTPVDNRFNIGYNRIEGAGSGPNEYASALIDDIGIFNRELTAGEIALLADSGQKGNGLFFGSGVAIG